MASVFEVLARLRGKDEATPAVKRAEGSFKKFQNFLASKFVITLGDVTRAARSIIRAFTATIEKAGIQEVAIAKLEARMKASGDFTAKASKQMQQFALDLQSVTTIGDETVLQMLTLAKSFGATNEQARDLIKVAADFAIAADLNITEAVRRIGRSFSGSVEDISKFAPKIKELSKEALASGAQIDILGEAVEGLAEAAAKTTPGALKQLGNAFGDLQEKLGFAITENEDFNKSLRLMKTFIEENGAAIGAFVASELSALINGIKLLVGYYTTLGTALGKVVVWFHNFDKAIEDSGPPLEALERTAKRLGITVEELRKRLKDASHEIGKVDTSTDKAEDGLKKLGKEAKKTKTEIDELTGATSKAETALEGLGEALGIITSADLAREIVEIQLALAKAREETGGNTREFIQYEKIAAEKIEKLRERMIRIKDGLGDITEETKKASEAFKEYGDDASESANRVEGFATANDRLAASLINLQERSRGTLSPMGYSISGAPQLLNRYGEPLFPGLSGMTGTFTTYRRGVTVTPDGRMVFV